MTCVIHSEIIKNVQKVIAQKILLKIKTHRDKNKKEKSDRRV